MRAHVAGALRMHWGQAVDGAVLMAGVDRASSAVAVCVIVRRVRACYGGWRAPRDELTLHLSPPQMPNYDGFYFAGVLLCVVGAGLLQYQSYGGKVRVLCN